VLGFWGMKATEITMENTLKDAAFVIKGEDRRALREWLGNKSGAPVSAANLFTALVIAEKREENGLTPKQPAVPTPFI